MANKENLKPLNTVSKEEAKKIQSKGGKARVQQRREKKTLKEELELLLLSDDRQNRMSLALLERAINGDVKAFEVIRDTIGQKPKDVVENINPPTININGLNI